MEFINQQINTPSHESSASTPAPGSPTAPYHSPALGIGLWLGTSIVCFFGALNTLGKVDWPQYLEYPAAKALAHLSGSLPILSQGYWLYLLSVLCLLPIVFMARESIPLRFGTASVALGTAAVLFKCMGIGRWLFAMPYLITTYAQSNGDAATRRALEIHYETLNRYAGGVGEQFGVALFTGLWVAVLTIGCLYHPSRWRFATGTIGVLTAAVWLLEVYLYANGGNVGAIRTVGSILTWIFIALFAVGNGTAPVSKNWETSR